MNTANLRRYRIAIDCRYIGAQPSGVAEVVQALVDYLPGLAPDLDFLFLRHPLRAAPLSGAANARDVVVKSAANGPGTLLNLRWSVDLSDVDLFHAPANIQPGGLTMPCITTVHDIMWLTHPHWCNPRLWGRVERHFYQLGIGRALARSEMIATVSEATRAAIVERVPDLAERISVTRSGVARDFAPVARQPALLAAAGLDPARAYCLIVGQNAPYKNHESALRAFALVSRARPDLDCVLLQRRGAGAGRLQQIAQQYDIADRVHFLGPVSREVLIQLYASAMMLLHPSLCEGFGNPVAEAMACGCPVITSNLSAMPEVAGGAAKLVDPFNVADIAASIRLLADDAAVCAELRRKGLARAQELDWRDFAAANLALYRRVLAR